MIPVEHTFKQIGFTGDYSQLKHMGFEFQKLYAANYMQWCHEDADIRIWKKGADLCISRIQGMEGQLLQMMLDNTTFHIRRNRLGFFLTMYKDRLTNTLSLDESGYAAEVKRDGDSIRAGLDLVGRRWEAFAMNRDTMLMLQKLGKLGWIHVKDVEGTLYVEEELLDAA